METKKDKKFTILFVCSGNACRSPMAEGLLKKKLYQQFKTKLKVHSAGTLGISGSPATPNAITVAKEKGVDISQHISKGINKEIMTEADIIFVMADHHKKTLDEDYSKNTQKIFLLTNFGLDKKEQKNVSIKDPIGENLTFYRQVSNHIERELERVVPLLQVLIEEKLKDRV